MDQNQPPGVLPVPEAPAWGLLTDFYQLTMAYAYFRSGLDQREAVFHLTFRENPFGGGFTVACGLQPAIEYLEQLRFDEPDIAYLAEQRGADGQRLFPTEFLDFLRAFRFGADVDAVPEGTVVFPHEPLVRVQGPMLHGQIVETALLNILNFQTLIATKAARVVLAAAGDPVLEFGLRRAQGFDGALAASRAAYIGGCAGTSNVLAGRRFGIPVRGTHAHSWVMCFDSEQEAFQAYAEALPNHCIFLVDTYDTLEGVRHAVEVGQWLRGRGQRLLGVRLDSGDLTYLSIEARRILDQAGFGDAVIVASNELDEHLIANLKTQGAKIGVWGVGTRLVTGYDQPALGGVYKLSAIRDPHGVWHDRLKLSEQAAKTSTPGILQVRRFVRHGRAVADAIFDQRGVISGPCTIIDPADPTRRKHIAAGTPSEDLLIPVLRGGRRVYDPPPLEQARQRTLDQLALFHPAILRLVHPHEYPVGLEAGLYQRKTEMILKARGFGP